MRKDLAIFHMCWVTFAMYKVTEHFYPAIPFFHAYLEDLLVMPLMLKSAQLAIQVLWKTQRNYVIHIIDVMLITIGVSVYFEAILPRFDARFTADFIDVMAYATGSLVFVKMMNVPLYTSKSAMT